MAVMDHAPGAEDPCRGLRDDLGWAIGTVFRTYAKAVRQAFEDLPGGPRGYQVLTAAGSGLAGTQLTLAAWLGVDRTVMTYLLDDLEKVGLIARQPDPADRRARRIVLTEEGGNRLGALNCRLAEVEETVLAALEADERATFRTLVQKLAARSAEPSMNTCTAVEEAEGELPPERPRRRRRAPARPTSR
jgi:DNA-binding MarR family transcriptional regulator